VQVKLRGPIIAFEHEPCRIHQQISGHWTDQEKRQQNAARCTQDCALASESHAISDLVKQQAEERHGEKHYLE
jgi:hypothetical protein